ncbi:MAG: hypothetical protein E3J35_06885 [Methanomassiliicoccales archaeon]|nr:MAG: hypothetical protein E3J35_06885 [Methanomassiliicoccales archaeon]
MKKKRGVEKANAEVKSTNATIEKIIFKLGDVDLKIIDYLRKNPDCADFIFKAGVWEEIGLSTDQKLRLHMRRLKKAGIIKGMTYITEEGRELLDLLERMNPKSNHLSSLNSILEEE